MKGPAGGCVLESKSSLSELWDCSLMVLLESTGVVENTINLELMFSA